ncbi:hypothetical protein HK405_012375, partial [Cladochytrium tenue]
MAAPVPVQAAASVVGLGLALATLAATAAGRLRSPPLGVVAAILVVWETAMLILNTAALRPRFAAALAANASSTTTDAAAITVVEYLPDGLAYFVDGDDVFQGLCELSAFLYSAFGLAIFSSNFCVALELFIRVRAKGAFAVVGTPRYRSLRGFIYTIISLGIPLIQTCVVRALRPTKAYFVLESFCDMDCSNYTNFGVYILVPGLLSIGGAILVVLSARSYTLRRREILAEVKAILLQRRRDAEAVVQAASLAGAEQPRSGRGVNDDVIDDSAAHPRPRGASEASNADNPDNGDLEDSPASLMGLLQFMRRMVLWCGILSTLAVVYVVVSIVDALPHGLEPGYA